MNERMKAELMKQMIFDCAMDLLYDNEYTKEDAADKLIRIIKYMDNGRE